MEKSNEEIQKRLTEKLIKLKEIAILTLFAIKEMTESEIEDVDDKAEYMIKFSHFTLMYLLDFFHYLRAYVLDIGEEMLKEKRERKE